MNLHTSLSKRDSLVCSPQVSAKKKLSEEISFLQIMRPKGSPCCTHRIIYKLGRNAQSWKQQANRQRSQKGKLLILVCEVSSMRCSKPLQTYENLYYWKESNGENLFSNLYRTKNVMTLHHSWFGEQRVGHL